MISPKKNNDSRRVNDADTAEAADRDVDANTSLHNMRLERIVGRRNAAATVRGGGRRRGGASTTSTNPRNPSF